MEYSKRLGAQDRGLLVVSMGTGLVLGAGYQLAVLAPDAVPTSALGWYAYVFGIVIYGLALGLTASGVYDVANGIFKKALGR